MQGVWSVVVAGGSGDRFGRLKQFAMLAGRPVVDWSVAACRACSEGVVVVLPAGSTDRSFGADLAVAGGRSRSESVRRGLAAVPEEASVIVVHDAARPLASAALFAAVLGALADREASGAICALPVADTLKRVGGDPARVVATVDRSDLVAVQTPQAFRADVLRRAHAAGADATDDAALVEALGATVLVVPGDPRNIKLTTPADLTHAEHLLTG
jgi:2-C-methyl-D-erythritol 4-phosphate cytidylyltransferase